MKPISNAHAAFSLRILYVLWIALGILGLNYIPSIMIFADDTTKTAVSISQNKLLFGFGISANVLMNLVFVFAALYLFKLLSQINKDLSAIMVILALISVPIALAGEASSLLAMKMVFRPEQMSILLGFHESAYVLASVFWGAWLFPLGFLVLDSGYFPKFIALAVLAGGLGHLMGAFAKIIIPEVAIAGNICEILTLGELIFALWLILIGPKIPNPQT